MCLEWAYAAPDTQLKIRLARHLLTYSRDTLHVVHEAAVHVCVWHLQEGAELVQRQGGQMDSGQRVHVYSADMRRRVALQFWPDGYEWAEKEARQRWRTASAAMPQASAQRQPLPQSFRVRHGQSAQGIFMAREITNAWALSEKASPWCSGRLLSGSIKGYPALTHRNAHD